MLAILNYGMANLRSVQKAFAAVGHDARIVEQPSEALRADRLVLPGVGAAGDALAKLRQRGLDEALLAHIDAGRPFLGICLGLQMLFDICQEGGEHRGLGVLRGRVVALRPPTRLGLKVPHMGWNTLEVRRPSPLLAGLPEGASVYFVHGYHALCEEEQDIAAVTDYGGPVVASVWRGNVVAAQFHPEKSQAVGLRMLSNFAAM